MMNKEWYAAKELVGIAGFPTTPQAINQRAKSEGWRKQKRSGVQGKALEYHISSFPDEVVSALLANEESSFYLADMPKAEKAWSAIYYQLTEEERELLTHFIMRQGINALFERLGARPQAVTTPDEENIEPVS
ncbi:DNA-binding protein [Hafnia paralvei]|uniref:DNA-binding protein n=2 Tax=Hafnia paralvei TaxID=546367 RepID=UPI001D0E2ED7